MPAHPIHSAVAALDEVELLSGGQEAFPKMLRAIDGATRLVHLEVFKFERDGVGTRFVEALKRAAARGVRVSVVMDAWGSSGSGESIADELRLAGAEASIYHPLLASFRGKMERNHRKVVVVDDEVAFVGGLNIADEYDGVDGWADVAVRIRGPACHGLGGRLRGEGGTAPHSNIRILLSAEGGSRRLRRRYLKAFGAAKHRIALVSSYFLPDRHLLRSIRAAARRGVSVTLLVPGKSDVPLITAATRLNYPGLLKAGVDIFEWHDSVLHAKAVTVDGDLALIGSMNFDPWSAVNLEVIAEIRQSALASSMDRWISDRVLRSRRVQAKVPGVLGALGAEVGRGALRRALHVGRIVGRLLRDQAKELHRKVTRPR